MALLILWLVSLSSYASESLNLIKQPDFVAAGDSMSGAAYGNGCYVSVGYYNCIIRSTDGFHWSVIQAPNNAGNVFISDVAFGNGLFVAVDSTGGIRTSADGLTWAAQASGTANYLVNIRYLNGNFVVPGNNGTLLLSTNGTNWTSIATGVTGNLAGRVAYNGSNYLLRDYESDQCLIFRATSLSGSWSSAGNPSGGDFLNFVDWLNNKYWLFTSGGKIYTSVDGTTWTQYTSAPISGTGKQVFGGVYANSTYVFFGFDGTSYGAIWTSANGTSFTEVSPRPNSTVAQSLEYLNGDYVECGNDGEATGTNYNRFYFQGGNLNGVSYGGGNYVIVGTAGSDGYITTSSDWTNWSNVSPQLLPSAYAVTYGSGVFVAVGDLGTSAYSMTATSPDGTTWTVGNSGNANALYAVATDGNGTFIAVGGNGTIVKSVNAGSSWTTVASGTNYIDAVTYANGLFVAVGDSGSVFYSTTGDSWNRADYTIDSGSTLYGVTYGPGGYVISGADSNYNLLFASRASLTSGSWSRSPFIATNGLSYLALVTTNASGYVAAYNDTNEEAYVLTSPDGINWNQIDTGDDYSINDISYLNNAVRIVGSGDYKLEAVTTSSQVNQSALVFNPTTPQAYNTTNTLTTTGGSGTGAVSYAVLSGPGSIVNNTQLVVTAGSGVITIVATKAADASYYAISATNSVAAAPASQAALTFTPATPQVYNTTDALSATGGSGSGAVTYTVLSGPGTIVNGTQLLATAGTGVITVVASKAGDGDYSPINATNTVTAALAGQAALTFTPATPQVYNTTNALSATGGSGSGALTYTVLSGPGTIVNGTQLLATAGTGIITIVANKAGDGDYSPISATNTVTAALASQTALTFTPATPQVYNTTNALSATGGSGSGALTYTVLSGPGTIVNGTQLLATAGTGIITVVANKAGDSDYSPISATNTVTAALASQAALIFTPATPQVFNTTNALSTTGGSGSGAVTYTVLSGPGTIINGTQLLATAGTGVITIVANKAGDGDYSSISATNTVVVGGAPLTLMAVSYTKTYGDTNPVFTVTGNGFVAGDSISNLSGTLSFSFTDTNGATVTLDTNTPVGIYNLVPSGLTSANYSITFSNGTLTVAPASLTVTATSLTKTYGAGLPTLTWSYQGFVNGEDTNMLSGAPMLSTAASASSSVTNNPYVVAITNGTLTASNYVFDFQNGSLTVLPVALTVTATNQSVVYGSAFPAFTGSLVGVTNNDNLTVSFYTVAGVQSGAGLYSILPAFNDPNGVLANYTVTTNVGTLVIQAAPLGVTADAQTRTYGATNPIFTITYTGLAPWDTSASLATVPVATSTATTASTIGHYPITVSGGVSPNYTFSYTNGTLSVTKASLVVAGANASRPYGATNPVFTATLTGIENGDNLAARFATTAGTNSLPGQYTIQLTVYDPTGKLGQYNTTLNSGILTITNALLTGTVQDVARQYGQTNPVFTVAYTGFVNSEGTNLLSGDLTFVCTDTNGVNVDTNTPVGVYAIDVTNGPTAPNYTVQFVNGTLTVTQAVLTVTAINAQKVYGTTNPLLAATITGYQNNDNSNVLSGTLLFTNSADATSTVGAYPITLGGLTATNYALDFVTGTLTVTQAPLAVTVNSTNRLYGQANPAFTGVVTGVLNDDDLGISYGSTATAASAVGTYAIAPAFADPDGRLQNYTLSATNGTLTVQAAPLAVTAYSTNRLYGQTNPIFVGTLVGVVNEDNITASFGSTATAASAVGAYAIVPTLTDPSSKLGNYVVSSTNGTLTVSSATLVVTAASQSRNYGQANAAFTVNYSGLVNGQDATVVSGTPSFICVDGNGIAVGATTPVGVYAIIPGGLTAPNYSLVYSNGSLTINQATLTVTPNAATRTYGATNPVFTATYAGFANSETTNVLSGQPALGTTAGLTSPVGGYNITAALGTLSATNYNFTFNTGTLSVTAAPLSGLVASWERAYGQTNPVFAVTYSGFVNGETTNLITGAIGYSCLDSNAVPVDTNTWVGTYAITVSTPQTAVNYTITYPAGALTVTQAVLLASADPQGKAFGTTNPPLTYTLSGFVNDDGTNVVSGQPVLSTAAVTNSPVGAYPIEIALGTLSATNYSFSLSNSVLTVAHSLLTVTAVNQTRLYGQTNPVLTVVYSGFVDGDDQSVLSGSPTVTTAATTNTGVGSYPITVAAGTLSAENYALSLVPGTLTIGTTPLGIVAQNAARQYGTANPAFSVVYDGLVNGETNNVLSGALTLTSAATVTTDVGAYAIVPAGLTSTNYAISFTNGTLTITQAPLTVVAFGTNRLYGATNPVFAGTVTGVLNSDNLGITFGTTATAASPAGTYSIVPAYSNPENKLQDYAVTTTDGVLTVGATSLTVTADNQTRGYGQTNPVLTVEYSGFVNGDGPTSLATEPTASTTAEPTNAIGQYPITVGGGSSPNYTFTYVPGTLTVTQANLSILGNSVARAYGQTNPVFTSTITGVVNGDDITVSYSTTATPTSAPGNYDIRLVVNDPDGKLGEYSLTLVSGTLTVTNALLLVTVDNQSRLYGQANPAFTAEYSGWVNGQGTNNLSGTLTYSCLDASGHAVKTNTPVGAYTINASGLTATDYSLEFVPGTLTIGATPLTVTGANTNRTYGAANPAFGVTYSGFVNLETSNVLGGTLAITTPAVATSPIGTYAIIPAGLTSSNYSLTFNNGTLAVTPAALAGQVQAEERAYGQTNPVFAVVYNGFVNSETTNVLTGTLTYSCLDTNGAAVNTNTWVGTYPIAVTTPQTDTNYNITYQAGSLTVTQAVLLASADPQSRVYGVTNPPLTYTLSGFVNDDGTNVVSGEPVLSTAAVTNSPVGQYVITIEPGALSATNYSFSLTNGVLTVGKAALTVTAVNQTRLYGQTNPVLTVAYSGFVDGDSQSILSGSPAVTTAATTNTGVGSYPIAVAAGTLSAQNYVLTLVNGTLTINATPLDIVAQNATRQYGLPNPAFSASYAGFVNGETNGALSGTLTLTSATDVTTPVGTYAIVPAGVTSTNYTISFTDGTLTVTQALLTVTANNASREYGAPNPAFTGTINGLYNSDPITATYATTATQASPAGTYAIVPSLVDPSNKAGNYDVTLVSGVLTVTVEVNNPTGTNITGFYVVGDVPAAINTNALIADGGGLNYNGAKLVVTIITNGTAEDELTVSMQGTGAGEIDLTGTNVTYGGTTFASMAGGAGTEPIQFVFNAEATTAAVSNLLRQVAFYTSNTNTAFRTLEVALTVASNTVVSYETLILDRPPVTGPSVITATFGVTLQIPFSLVLTNDYDVDGDPLTITDYSDLSAYGGRITNSGTAFIYAPPASQTNNDLFAYIVSDGRGGSTVGTINLEFLVPNELKISLAQFATNGAHLSMAGVPDRTYLIQASTNLITWTNWGTATANTLGIIQIQDMTATNYTKRFYRAEEQ